MPKRPSSTSSDPSSGLSEMNDDVKPKLSSDTIGEMMISPSKKAKKSPKKASPKKGEGERQTPRSWTQEEDDIFIEIIHKMVITGAWQAIKDDGRLEYRGNPGCRAHAIALMNKLKKA